MRMDVGLRERTTRNGAVPSPFLFCLDCTVFVVIGMLFRTYNNYSPGTMNNRRSASMLETRRQQSLRYQIHSIMTQLRDFNPTDDLLSSTLYNDFLIVGTILNSVPEAILEELQRELASFDSRLRSPISILGRSKEELSLKPIAEVLMRVEEKDMLLQDFLVCGGFYENYS